MTEYWVSQGNKWCDFCKIYIANNPLSIRTHELGKRHKDNVAKRLTDMQKEGAAREKEQKKAAKALEQIEAKARQSYQKDLASFQELNSDLSESSQKSSGIVYSQAPGDGWDYEVATGYYVYKASGFHFDASSGLYYSAALGSWVSQEEALKSGLSRSAVVHAKSSTGKAVKGGSAPGVVIANTSNPIRNVKGAQSSIAVTKRKREDEKPKTVSKEEEAALRVREAAKKRVEEREKPLMGLYRPF